MTTFDEIIIRFLQQFVNCWPDFDSVVMFVRTANLLKGGVLVALLWYAWFRKSENRQADQELIIATFLGAFCAMVIARALALALPFRLRPLHDQSLGFLLPTGMPPEALDGWSSFPSDHAALFFALSTGLFLISRRLGMIALIHTCVVICFPRIYLGLHFPTDILSGALVGIAAVFLVVRYTIQARTTTIALTWAHRSPWTFYPGFFLLSQQIISLFQESRAVGAMTIALLKRIQYFLY